MSRIYEALQQTERARGQSGTFPFQQPADLTGNTEAPENEFKSEGQVKVTASSASRLIALTEPTSLGAEQFRALVTRLENLRRQKEMKSLQVTSSVINEGKTVVSANLAFTLAQQSHSKVLLLEGDLRRPRLAAMLSAEKLKGIGDWWLAPDQDIANFLYRVNGLPLWFLSAGTGPEQPAQILQSSRLAEAFSQLSSWFDWIIVDSTPMVPVADANLWSRLVDGTLLVIREGVASVKVLQKGLTSLDNLKLIGTVLNDASEFQRDAYANEYYGVKRETDATLKQ